MSEKGGSAPFREGWVRQEEDCQKKRPRHDPSYSSPLGDASLGDLTEDPGRDRLGGPRRAIGALISEFPMCNFGPNSFKSDRGSPCSCRRQRSGFGRTIAHTTHSETEVGGSPRAVRSRILYQITHGRRRREGCQKRGHQVGDLFSQPSFDQLVDGPFHRDFRTHLAGAQKVGRNVDHFWAMLTNVGVPSTKVMRICPIWRFRRISGKIDASRPI